jgi:hypothetical protein
MRSCEQLLYYLEEKRRNWNLRGEALNCTVWRTRFGRDYGCVAMLLTQCITEREEILYSYSTCSYYLGEYNNICYCSALIGLRSHAQTLCCR